MKKHALSISLIFFITVFAIVGIYNLSQSPQGQTALGGLKKGSTVDLKKGRTFSDGLILTSPSSQLTAISGPKKINTLLREEAQSKMQKTKTPPPVPAVTPSSVIN